MGSKKVGHLFIFLLLASASVAKPFENAAAVITSALEAAGADSDLLPGMEIQSRDSMRAEAERAAQAAGLLAIFREDMSIEELEFSSSPIVCILRDETTVHVTAIANDLISWSNGANKGVFSLREFEAEWQGAGVQFPVVPASEGSILLVPEELDAGEFRSGDKISGVFVIRNDAPETVRIKEIKTSCRNCTTAVIPTQDLLPGQTQSLRAFISSDLAPGHHSYSVNLSFESNSGSEWVRTGTISAAILKDVSVSPERIEFGRIPKGETKRSTLFIDTLNEELEVEPRNSMICKAISVENQGILRETRSGPLFRFAVGIETLEGLEVGVHTGIVQIKTNAERFSEFNVPVSATIEGGLSFDSKEIQFGLIRTKKKYEKRIIAKKLSHGIEITGYEGGSDSLSVQVSDKPDSVELLLTFTPESDELLDTSIVLLTNDDSLPRLELRVRGIVRIGR